MRLEDFVGSETARAWVAPDNNGEPGVAVYQFPDRTITSNDVQAVSHVGDVLLEPNKKYWILLERVSQPATPLYVHHRRSDDVVTGLPDWILATTSSYNTLNGYVALNTAYAIRLEGTVLTPTTDEPSASDFSMEASTRGRLRIGETSSGVLDAVGDNRSGDLLRIEGLTAGNSYRVRAWFGTSKEDSATAARGGAIGLQFSRAGIDLSSLSPHNDNLLDDGRASFVFPAFANEEYYVDLVAPAFRPPNGTTPAHTYYGPYMLEIYDLVVTQRALGVTTGGTITYSEGYGIKSSNICVNNRCFNDPRFPEFHQDGYENTETHEVSVGNNPLSKNFSQATVFKVDNRSNSPTASYKLDRIGAFVHGMTGSSIPQAAIHADADGPGAKLFDLEPLYNDDGHIDYFLAPRDAQALTRDTEYAVVFSEGGGSNASYKLYATAIRTTEDDNRHPNWPISFSAQTKDNDASSPTWLIMRSGDTPSGDEVYPQIEVYAGVAE